LREDIAFFRQSNHGLLALTENRPGGQFSISANRVRTQVEQVSDSDT